MVAGTILALASYPASAMKQILSGTIGAVLFSIFILLPAVFMGNPQILLTIGTKVFLSVTLIGMLSAGTAWNKLTARPSGISHTGYFYIYIRYHTKIYRSSRRNLYGNTHIPSSSFYWTE